VRAAIYDSLQKLILFPYIGRRQTTEGVWKIVTNKYPYLIYYAVKRIGRFPLVRVKSLSLL
jgi:toxin ParE1/3/4